MISRQLDDIVACPHPHRLPLVLKNGKWGCSDTACPDFIGTGGFPEFNGSPVLIDFSSDTVCSRERYVDNPGTRDIYVKRRLGHAVKWIKRLGGTSSPVTVANCCRFVAMLKERSQHPRVLIIGSGEPGQGTRQLWSDPEIERFGIDIYATATTSAIADAHQLPFRDSCFDGIWIQAVLEHVPDPQRVVSEIERTLATGGVVYAETPFMQQVHEGAYDFQRFSVTGHRYLFRHFAVIAMGGNKGPGVALAWAIRYFFWGLLRSRKLAVIISYPALIFLRLFDRLMDPRILWDAPSGVFFLGRKEAGFTVPQRDLPELYEGLQQ